MQFTHGGARVGAGRKPFLENKTIEQICRLSASSILKALRANESEFSLEKKVELGKHFALKTMPQKVESDGSFAPKTIILSRNEKSEAEIKDRSINVSA